MSEKKVLQARPRLGARVLDAVERAGNRLPEPFLLFLLLFLAVGAASALMAALGTTVDLPDGGTEPIRSLFSAEGLAWFTTTLVDNFIGFPPLGVVLTVLLGVGVAQRSGLLTALVRRAFGRAPRWMLPYVVGIIGVSANIMSDASMILVPSLAALVFAAAGRHPVAGLLGGFAAATAGFSVGPFITGTDALLSGITTAAAEPVAAQTAPVTVVSNYFISVSCAVLLAGVAGLLIDKVLEPALERRGVSRTPVAGAAGSAGAPGAAGGGGDDEGERADLRMDPELSPVERRGLLWAGAALLVLAAAVLAVVLPPNAPLRGEGGSFLPESPLLDSVVFLVFLALAVPGVVYGAVTREITGGGDVARMMGAAVKDMSGFIVVAFVLAQFLALFNWSRVSDWIAVSGAETLEGWNFTGYGALIAFTLLACVINIFVISGSAQWAVFAAVFVPLFALLGYEPGFVQAMFRVGDSSTNAISPLNPYMVVVLGLLRAYEPKAGLGTVIARCLPFSLTFLVLWTAVLSLFYFTGTPVGPGMDARIAP
ncbi:AbgT family transporter [Nocardiopsis sp. RSe5-2]|uniref:AbgT family transporter n=1 Tax=Nocardiopsis endophytica TaxID=3018445 RepID=A0ABT4U731_9ACTN|nr:AbgT family transporter [Nocardiopsis endophytica]MDA2812760.1 AbgT family transporter [Nocardiopsis endophytica]